MRNLVVGVASAAVLSSIAFGAQAADLIISPSYEQPVAQSSASSDVFTGVYIGGTAGVVTSDNFSENNSAATVGAQVGYLQQFGAFVIGAEAEALYLNDLKYQLDATGGVQQNWSLAAKARAGVALDHTLIYGTLGYGITSFSGLDAVTVTNPDDVKGGVVFGGGIEQAFNDSISGRVEYLQSRYDGVATSLGSNDLVNHSVKLGVNFRF